MDSNDQLASPLDAVAGIVGEQTVEAFGVLGNETRLAILLALWEAKVPGPPLSAQTVSFSDLRERVGMRDSGQFNYHLKKLAETFIEQTDEGYILTTPGEQVLRAVLAGTLTDAPALDGEPIDVECFRCSAPVVMDYSEGEFIERCTSCEGLYRQPDDPPGMISKGYLPPVGLEHRTPKEFHRHGNTWDRNRFQSMMEGACPDCSGHVTPEIHVCENHDSDEETICEACGSMFEIRWLFACDICKFDLWTPGQAPVFTDIAVLAFFHDHGLDFHALYDESATEAILGAIERVAVETADPLKVGVTIELDGDHLEVTLDDEARVIDVTEEDRDSA